MYSDELRSDDLIVRRYECDVRVCRESLHVMRAKCDIRRGECTHILTPIHTAPAYRSPLPPFLSLLTPSAYPPHTHTQLPSYFSASSFPSTPTPAYRHRTTGSYPPSTSSTAPLTHTHTHIRQTPGSSCGCRWERQGHVGLPVLFVGGGCTIRRGLHRIAT